jgi:hypothetical protein
MSNLLHDFEKHMFDKRYDWAAIDKAKANETPEILDLLREACLVESVLPAYIAKMMELFWDDMDASTIFTVEGFEAYTHYYTLRRYLDEVDYKPITDEEVIGLRRQERESVYDNPARELVNFMATEHFAAAFFKDVEKYIQEPILKSMMPRFVDEEVRHSQFAADLLAGMLAKDPSLRPRIIEAVKNSQHIGSYFLPKIHPITNNNMATLVSFNRRIEELLGESLSDVLVKKEAA